MKRILTALDNQNLYNKIKNINFFYVYEKDIQYKEGIIEILKKDKSFDIIIIYEKIPGEMKIEKLIKEIKIINNKLKIIVILENKDERLEKILESEDIKNIFYNNQINFNEFINKIKNINLSEEEMLKKEINKLNKIIINKNKEILKYKNNPIHENKDKIILVLEDSYQEIKKYKKIIEKLKSKFLIENEKINLSFIESKNGINIRILKCALKEYKILGKLKI